MRRGAVLLIAASTGFIALSYEILWYRTFAFASGTSPAVFGFLLGSYLLGIAAGSIWARGRCREEGSSGNPAGLSTVAGLILVANVVSFMVVPAQAWLATTWRWEISFALVFLGAGLMGATLPLLAHYGIPPDDRSGARLSYLYLANILGSALGSLITGFVLLDTFPFADCARVLLVAGAAASVLAGGRAALALGVAVVLGLLTPTLHDELWERLLFKGDWKPGTPFKRTLENRHGVICIRDDDVVYGGGMYDGMINADIKVEGNGIARPWSLLGADRRYRRVLVIGVSMGSWTKVMASFPDVEEIAAVEINPGYLELIREYPQVSSILSDDRVRVITDDGRRWLNRNPEERFDLIVQNTTYHYRAHMTNLLSKEYMELCKRHLTEDGVMLFNTTGSEDAMLTALTVFPHGMRVYNNMMVSRAPLGFDVDRWIDHMCAVRLDGEDMLSKSNPEHRAIIKTLRELFSASGGDPSERWFEPGAELRPRILGRGAAVITDDNMLCEW